MQTITKTYNIYNFDELSEAGRQHALEKLYDLNVDRDWWEWTYEDAKNVGLKITGFDIDRGSYVEGELITTMQDSIEKIMAEHGNECETYQVAKEYHTKLWQIANSDEDALEELEAAYTKDLCEAYLGMLRREYEYLISAEAIIETIHANDYQFTEDGELA